MLAIISLAVVGGGIVTMGAAVAAGGVDPAAVTTAIDWLKWLLSQPWAWAPLVLLATNLAKWAAPALGRHKPFARAVAGLLSVLAAFLAAAAGGDLAGFGVEQALTQLGEALQLFLIATGLYKLTPQKPA